MKKLFKFLKASVVMLALVAGIFCISRIFAGGEVRFTDKSESDRNESLQDKVVNVQDVLKPVGTASDGANEKINDNVKSDYKPVDASGQLVEEDATPKEKIQGAVQKYDFAENMYPYRAMLNENQQKIYDQIYESANELKTDVKLCSRLDANSVKKVMTAVFCDHPELFWLETEYVYSYIGNGTVVSVTLKYNETATTLQSSKKKFLNAAADIINKASGYGSDLEKEKYVYKAIQNICKYDENSSMNQSAYSALVNKSSVCAGYTRAFQYIMQQLNIPCYFCSGYANGGYHAWNIVYIDGKYYNVDISWDDSLGEMTDTISYSYFNLADIAISADHSRRDMSVNLPSCD